MRPHISLEDDLVAELDRRVGRRRRSAFIAETLRRPLDDQRRWDAIEAALGGIEDAGHAWDQARGGLGPLRAPSRSPARRLIDAPAARHHRVDRRAPRAAGDRLLALRATSEVPYACAVNVEEVTRGLGERDEWAARRLFEGLRMTPLGRREGDGRRMAARLE